MTRIHFFIVSAVIGAVIGSATIVMPEPSASPEPDLIDPMVPSPSMNGMSLYIVSAGDGSDGRKMKLLGEASTVCPSDYPSGFSVECRSSFPAATFYVNGDGVRKEKVKPFYIAGDAKGVVRRWNPPAGESRVWVACKYSGKRVRSRISFGC